MKLLNLFKPKKEKNATGTYSYFLSYGNQLGLTAYDDPKLAIEGYIKNIIVYRAITLIADGVARGKWRLFNKRTNSEIFDNELLTLLNRPYVNLTRTAFLSSATTQLMIYGNRYIEKWTNPRDGIYRDVKPLFLLPLRPDWISVIDGVNMIPERYKYAPDKGGAINFQVTATGKSNIIHGKLFNPQNGYSGLSPLVPAGYSIDTHNALSKMNFSFLENGAKPSGVLTVPKETQLGDEGFNRLKEQMDTVYSGSKNTGKPMLLEGGMTWTQISVNSKDGEFTDIKKQVTHEVALAFGIPIELLNTEQSKYDNLNAANEQLYHDKIMPTAEAFTDDINADVTPSFGKDLEVRLDYSHTKTMQASKMRYMEKLNPITFMTDNEKRQNVGMEYIDGGDELPKKGQPITPQMNEYIAKEMTDGIEYNEALEQAKLIYQ